MKKVLLSIADAMGEEKCHLRALGGESRPGALFGIYLVLVPPGHY